MSSSTDNLFESLKPATVPVADDVAAVDRPDELSMLKSRAKLMGISFSNNIGLDALREKVDAKINGEAAAEDAAEETSQATDASDDEPVVTATKPPEKPNTEPPQTRMSMRQEMIAEQMRLIRVRITNLDPKKKDLPGEIFTVANRFIGTVRKYIPYGEVTDNGYHIPFCIYTQLEERKFLNIKTRKGKNGTPIIESQYVREFALEILPQLTADELAKLAASQAAAGGTE